MRGKVMLLALLTACGCVGAVECETTLADRTGVAVTAYNNGIALVRDTRAFTLPEGEVALRFMDVAQQIRPETVSLRSLAAPGSVVILEQNYEYDLMSPSKLMEKYVGQPVKLVNMSDRMGFQEVDATLLSTNESPIYQVGEAIYLGHPGNVVLPRIPDNLIAEPALIWRLDNQRADQQLEATYLTGGISWRADYVVTLARDETSLELTGWVTMDNQSGTTYTNARLKFVAGEVNIMSQVSMGDVQENVSALGYMDNLAREETFSEYHLYTMPQPTTIKDNQSKQLALLSAAGVTCKKKYEFRGQAQFFSQKMPPMPQEGVEVFLEFRNDAANRLGMPLPAGTMRVYQPDSEGAMQFSGEDAIQHTPKDEDVQLRLGKAFDVVGERVQKSYQLMTSRIFAPTHESEYEITLRNHKDTDVVVDIIEPMPGDWDIRHMSHPFEKRDARTAVFHVSVPKDGEVKVTYLVRIKG